MVVEWERAAHEIDATGVRLAIVRSGQILDAGGGMLAELLPPFKLGVGGPLAGGDQYISWIHADDEVGILLWALDDESVSGVVNATAPTPATNNDFSKALGRALGRPAVVPVPGFVLDLKFGSEFGAVLKGRQRVIPKGAGAGIRVQVPRAGQGAPRPALARASLSVSTDRFRAASRSRPLRRIAPEAGSSRPARMLADHGDPGGFDDRAGEARRDGRFDVADVAESSVARRALAPTCARSSRSPPSTRSRQTARTRSPPPGHPRLASSRLAPAHSGAST